MARLGFCSPLSTCNRRFMIHKVILRPAICRCQSVGLTPTKNPSRIHTSATSSRASLSCTLEPRFSPRGRYPATLLLACTTTTKAGFNNVPVEPDDASASKGVDQRLSHLPAYQLPSRGILSMFPDRWVPYLELSRIDRTNGFYGFYVSYLIGMGWAASISPATLSLSQVGSVAAVFVVWTVWHRGAVCTINDIFDRDYDRQVERTRLRPLARRAIPVSNAWRWYWVQVAASAGIVGLMPHATECFYHAVPIVFLLSVYPLFKRWTDFPQVVLAVPLSWAILLSCSALGVDPWTVQSTAVTAASLCLFGSEMARIVVLDYVNACQDTLDDIKAGVKSMAVRYRDTVKFIATMGGIQVSLLVAAGVLAQLSPIFFAVGVGGNIAMISWMAKTVDRKTPKVCAWWFQRASWLIGGMTALALYLEYASRIVKRDGKEKLGGLEDDDNAALIKH